MSLISYPLWIPLTWTYPSPFPICGLLGLNAPWGSSNEQSSVPLFHYVGLGRLGFIMSLAGSDKIHLKRL